MRGAMVNVLGESCKAIFACVSMLTDHDHWILDDKEADKLGEALDKALATLPERAYEKVIEVADKWHPWARLTFVAGILVWTRIEESSKLAQGQAQRVEGADYQPNERGVNGSGGFERGKANANYWPRHSSLGYDN